MNEIDKSAEKMALDLMASIEEFPMDNDETVDIIETLERMRGKFRLLKQAMHVLEGFTFKEDRLMIFQDSELNMPVNSLPEIGF